MRVVVTGGAGYIGSITANRLLREGHEVTILDDLSTGHREAIPPSASFVEGRVQEPGPLEAALRGADAVVHFASLSLVGESVRHPRLYFRENLSSALSLLEGMAEADVKRLVFSSSAAVYGEPDAEVIDEETPCRPVNPYGMSKLMIETILAEEARASGLSAMALRYFNACGSDGPLGEDHKPETHLIPRLCEALLRRRKDFKIYGEDYPTPDGTAVRDYVHVLDLARAHVLALSVLGQPGLRIVNLGTSQGASVKEVVEVGKRLAQSETAVPVGARREGDPPRLVASNARARELLKWVPRDSSIEKILADALEWHREHPAGYAGA